MSYKKILFVLLMAPFVLAACNSDAPVEQMADVPEQEAIENEPQAESVETLKIVTTFPPLYSFTKNIVGDVGDVTNLVPGGVSVHAWEPKASNLRDLTEADLLVMNGLELEPFVDDMVLATGNDDLEIIVTTDGLSGLMTSPEYVEIESEEEHSDDDHNHEDEEHGHDEEDHHDHEDEHDDDDDHDHEEEKGEGHAHDDDDDHDHDDHEDEKEDSHDDHEHGHHHGETDPHVWLSPRLAMQQVQAIRDALIEVAPQHEEAFRNNTEAYLANLETMDLLVREEFKDISFQNFIVFHDAYTYFFDAYGLMDYRKGAVELFPGREPGAAYLQGLIRLIEEEDVKVIFTEPQFSPDLVETIQNETGIESYELDPIGNEVSAKGYENNLSLLTEAFVEAFGN